MDKSFLYIFFSYIKSTLKVIVAYITFILIFFLLFILYSLEMEPMIYGCGLTSVIGTLFFIQGFIKYYRNYEVLLRLERQITDTIDEMPMSKGLLESKYQSAIENLYNNRNEISTKLDYKKKELMDYYTLWAHQIKTPIAAMKLLLQEEEQKNKELLEQLFKIEQYVQMVLGYLRIEDSSSDLVIKNYDLDKIIKQVIRKYSNIFIRRNIKLELEEIDYKVLTDEKWLVFVIEQIVSNSLKYTKSGKISIYMDKYKEKTLVIEDTGIGIAKEDLPRVFEKGFTGYNGRRDKKATGIGLYLCQKVLYKLSHKITIESTVDIGTRVKINLSSVKTMME